MRVLSVLQLLRWHCRKAPGTSLFKEADNDGFNLYDKTLSTRKLRAILSIRTLKKYEKTAETFPLVEDTTLGSLDPLPPERPCVKQGFVQVMIYQPPTLYFATH